MCGIVGYTGLKDRGYLSLMNARQSHRGPDESGEYWDLELSVGLAMSRLSILDISGGHQPMVTEDGNFVIVFNGEIFNASEIRKSLLIKGVKFSTDHSDTEVILKGYQHIGCEIVKQLNGMFAFVIYDKRNKTLFGARDPFGIKPLYYRKFTGGIAWASELKSFFCLPIFSRDLDSLAIQQYLGLQYIPQERSIYQCVKKVLPGFQFTYKLEEDSFKLEPYYHLPLNKEFEDLKRSEWIEVIREEFIPAVERWSISDVPIACSLSGGVDSAAIVASLCRNGNTVKTYTLGFDSKDGHSINELDDARQIAQLYGTEHHEIIVDADLLIDDLDKMIYHLDEPYGGGLPSWFVYKEIAKDVKVAMTGTGGDELFSNYNKFRKLERRKNFNRALTIATKYPAIAQTNYYISRTINYLRSLLHPELFNESVNILSQNTLSDLPHFWLHPFGMTYPTAFGGGFNDRLSPDSNEFSEGRKILEKTFIRHDDLNLRDRCVAVDFINQLPCEFLYMTDRFSMAHSLEVRTPFLDKKFVESVLKIPPNLRFSPMKIKSIFKDAFIDFFPPGFTDLPKKGFVIPMAKWLRGPLKATAEGLFNDPDLRSDGNIAADFSEKFYKPFLEGEDRLTQIIWTVFMFRKWQILNKK